MKKAVYNSKKERTKEGENWRRKPGGKFQGENFRKKIAKGIGNVWIWILLM